MFGTCSEHASQMIMDYWYLDFGMHGNGEHADFDNLIFWKREVCTIFENVKFLIFEVLGASRKDLLGGNSNPGHSEHVRNTMFGTPCSEHGTCSKPLEPCSMPTKHVPHMLRTCSEHRVPHMFRTRSERQGLLFPQRKPLRDAPGRQKTWNLRNSSISRVVYASRFRKIEFSKWACLSVPCIPKSRYG